VFFYKFYSRLSEFFYLVIKLHYLLISNAYRYALFVRNKLLTNLVIC